ncbi:MAG: nucleoside-diphosphate kinase [Spirochaetales bacterium]|nr:nucleoside-diphosphate kinase [Spirochaetales bacterium]
MAHEKTFAMLKPGILQRRVVGEIISRLERKGLRILALKLMNISRELAGQHYAEHQGKPFYDGLVDYMTSGPVVAMVLSGEHATHQLRKVCGPTNPDEATPGTIRGDFSEKTNRNVIHASDSVESAKREIQLFFSPTEIIEYEDEHAKWIY